MVLSNYILICKKEEKTQNIDPYHVPHAKINSIDHIFKWKMEKYKASRRKQEKNVCLGLGKAFLDTMPKT